MLITSTQCIYFNQLNCARIIARVGHVLMLYFVYVSPQKRTNAIVGVGETLECFVLCGCECEYFVLRVCDVNSGMNYLATRTTLNEFEICLLQLYNNNEDRLNNIKQIQNIEYSIFCYLFSVIQKNFISSLT